MKPKLQFHQIIKIKLHLSLKLIYLGYFNKLKGETIL
jgi:hypothetical protein